jgi:FKBP12-rapamycin complex-associated protein
MVASLQSAAQALPDLLEKIQDQLLDLLSLALSRRPFSPSTPRQKWMVGCETAS